MSAKLKLQKNLLKQIAKDIENFGKRSPKERTKNYLRNRLDTLEKTFQTSNEYNTQGVAESKPEEEPEFEDTFEKIKELYFDYKTLMLDTLDKIQTTEEITVSARVSNNNDKSTIRLPKINIPIFSGDYNTWRSFHDIFVSLIYSNKDLCEVEKLHYLKSSLRDEAERLLQHLPVNNGNFDAAWKILTARYDHKRVLVNAQLRTFFDQEIIRVESVTALKKLLDISVECRHALQNLQLPVEHWDAVFIFSMVRKLPVITQQLWEEKLGTNKDLPKFTVFCNFLEARFRTLEAVGQQQDTKVNKEVMVKRQSFLLKQEKKSQYNCKVCTKGAHALRTCNKFLKMDTVSRRNTVNRIGVCENCLAYSHNTTQCPSRLRCYFCQQPHHSLLHINSVSHSSHTTNTQHNTTQPAPIASTSKQQHFHSTHSQPHPLNSNALPFQSNQVQSLHTTQTHKEVLLATAMVNVRSLSGDRVHLRGLIDPGSEASFISRQAVQRLGLQGKRTHVEVSGLGKVNAGVCQGYVDLTLESLQSDFETNVQALIFDSLTGLLPSHRVQSQKWSHIQGLPLADPTFYTPAEVDLVLGNDLYSEIVLPQIVRDSEEEGPIAQNTLLGWVVMGKIPQPRRSIKSFVQTIDIDKQLRRFWEVEEIPFKPQQTSEDLECEKLFESTTKRLPSGRYELSLPFKAGGRPALGPSRQGALRRFAHLERRFRVNNTLKIEYTKCIQEYLQLGHMEEVDMTQDEVLRTPFHYVLPHHAVCKESSSTTKLRVVFDAAAKTLDGTSLNQHLMTGPKTQTDIIDIVLKWRRHKFTFTADIEKMYRQIRIGKEDSYYHLIFWRNEESEQVKLYRLQTVTFGTTCAPYLAIRCLNRLADDEAHRYPLGAQMVKEDIYVDDLFAGAHTVEEAVRKRKEVNSLLLAGGFSLRKWASNAEEILDGIPVQQRESKFSLPLNSHNHINALGIRWFPGEDNLAFQNIQLDSAEPTKRTILSTIAKLFDPLGWIAPSIIKGKIMMQQLWRCGCKWDEPLSFERKKEWTAFQEELSHLEKIRIPRWIHMSNTYHELELHGFSDASEKAYGAAVYLRILDSQHKIHSHLLMSKTRVAPVKSQTLPRLELCGAVMLATLLDYIAKVLHLRDAKQYAWTDSTITLAWIAAPPMKWATFVNHRVAEVQRLVKPENWKHIPSELNPADLASRGVMPSALLSNTLWWNGPEFLRESWEFQYPKQPKSLVTEEEKRSVRAHAVTKTQNVIVTLMLEHSNLSKLVRIVAYCRRFIKNVQNPHCFRNFNSLSPAELQSTTLILVRLAQEETFISEKAKIPGSLSPFSDSDGVLRVGGRLQHAELSFEQRHPIILKGNHHFTKLIIADAHYRTLHGGLQQTTAYLRNRFWILKFKNSVKSILHKCIICFRYRAKPKNQLMGNLPAPRVSISQPFTHAGVDYAGPINIKSWKGRGAKILKAYFAIFVCLVTKAIHIELVSDLTTQAFIAALRRFISRRGICTHIYSDNGTNFIGANKEVKKLFAEVDVGWKAVAELTAKEGIEWHFIPPASPHFGGLWEAGVKSVKHHLKRIIGEEKYTYEELSTFLHQVEACLNSRPLCPMTDNPHDFTALTPGHFLIGRALTNIPEANKTETKIGPLQRWQQMQKFQQTFWKRWTSEYLTRLQQRPKWLKVEDQPKIGDLVLLKEDNLPPGKWNLGRIIDTHPGRDNLVRVVTLKTATGEIKRPITKICILPSSDSYTQTH